MEGGLLSYERIKRKTLVFVAGAHHSGTSLLEAVLDTSPLTSVRAQRCIHFLAAMDGARRRRALGE